MNGMNDQDQKDKERPEGQTPMDDALSSAPFSGTSQYGEGGYYHERAKMHVQKDYSKGDPSGLDKTDEQLRDEIHESLRRHIHLDIEGIEVVVQSGVVILTGRVDSQLSKQTAEEAAGSVDGVQTVHNLLELDDPRRVHGESPLEK